MKLFCMQSTSEWLREYINENYISIDLYKEGLDKEGLITNIESYTWEQLCKIHPEIANDETFHLFFSKMEDGDFIIITDGEELHIGDVGDYYYVPIENQSSNLPPRLHRRGVTWLKAIDLTIVQLASPLKELIYSTSSPLSQLEQSITLAKLDSWISLSKVEPPPSSIEQTCKNSNSSPPTYVDEATIRLSVEVLQQALRSDNLERRERAAIALLHYAATEQAANRPISKNDRALPKTEQVINTTNGKATAQDVDLAHFLRKITVQDHQD